ncbi:acyl-CoA-binding domain-containing protein 3-like [Iris pallida]|uniref:Acyl-CoA-binding domain-containing protein 3-like n=1 Tax=Iris pallida TaxID=29817 RepID=A0AAX6EUS9_IRIPA|nr:acyl-CoA-binding domain-containing protein 3-like [Iris pallida]
MAFFDDLLFSFSFFSILLALLIGKLASAAATGGAGNPARDSLDPSQLSSKRERSEGSELVDDVQPQAEAGGGLERSGEARADELDRSLETSRAEEGSGVAFPEAELAKEEVYEFESEEEESGREGSLLHGEDEWEGIERSGTEKLFRVAADYAGSGNGGRAVSKLGHDVRMRLYGLQKVAAEGPCYEPRPMALKVSARARWHAWQRLGNMNPDVAMEQYISLLSESIPGWMGENSEVQAKHDKGNDIPYKGSSITCNPDLASVSLVQSSSEDHSILEDPLCNEIRSDTTTSKVFEKGLAKTFVLNLLCPTRGAFLVF